MSEVSQNNPQYIDRHPNAVADVGKARFMAEVMNPHETKSAQLRNQIAHDALQAAEVTDIYIHDQPFVRKGTEARSGELTRVIDVQNNLSNRKASDAADIYEALEKTKR